MTLENALHRSSRELLGIHRKWNRGDDDPLRDPNEGEPERTSQDRAEIELATATALVIIAQSLAELCEEQARARYVR